MKKKINIFYWWVFWILFLEYIYRIFIIKDFFNINTLIVTVTNINGLTKTSRVKFDNKYMRHDIGKAIDEA